MQNDKSSSEPYDSSWDRRSGKKLDQKFDEWAKRDWRPWLQEHLSFPFEVKRTEDDDEAYFTDIADKEPFRLGHVMKALALADDDPDWGITMKVSEGREIGYIPIVDLQVTSKKDPNYWPIREYAVWFVNSR